MGDILQPWHMILIGIVVVLLFGGRKLPELGKGLGEGWRGFKEGLTGAHDEVKNATNDAHTVTPKPEETATKL